MNRTCEVCGVEIPGEFHNALCYECYDKQVKENELKLVQEAEERAERGEDASGLPNKPTEPFVAPTEPTLQGIKDPNYQENPEAEDKEQWMTNIVQFQKTGHIIWHPTRDMYEWIKNWCMKRVLEHPQYPKFIWKPKIVDVGCGIGVGSNIVSQEADFVWGIDKNENSVKFAEQAFTRYKNGIYYNAQNSFTKIDIMEDTREFAKFDVVVAIEVIEHIADARKFLKTIIGKFSKKTKKGSYRFEPTADGFPTEFFISSPNRNNKHIAPDKPRNMYHCREWTSEEMFDFLSEYFENVKLMNSKGEPVERSTEHTPLLAQCSIPKI